MNRFLGRIIDIRKGEWTVTLLMFAYIFLLLCTYYFLKPARDSLFLVELGAEQLPLVFILIAVMVVPITTLYSRASRSLPLNRMIISSTLIIIVNLIILRWLLSLQASWVFYVFYIWVSIFGILTTAQFWLMANAVYDASQAKRVFVPFGLAAIIGAFVGGQVTSLLVSSLGVATENLLFFCMAFLFLCIVIVQFVWRMSQRTVREQPSAGSIEGDSQRKESFWQVFTTIRGNRHLFLIVGIITMTMMVASFVDYQFKTVTDMAFDEKEDLTSFMGVFYSYLSLASLLFQLVFSYRFLRVLGVTGVILFLPIGLLLASAAIIVWPSLWAGVVLRGADGSLKYSIDKTGRELLFLPIPLEIKKRTKMFIDMFVDRWSRGVAGAILLGVTALLPLQSNPELSLRLLSIPTLVLLVFWLVFIFMIRKEYVDTFRRALEKREIDISEIRVNINDASTVNTLIASLGSSNERQVVYALKMLRETQDLGLVWPVRPLLVHESVEVRRQAIRVLHVHGDNSVFPDAEKLLRDPDCEVRRDAMYLIARFGEQESSEFYREQLSSNDLRHRCTAVAAIGEYGSLEDKAIVTDDTIAGLLRPENRPTAENRQQIAGALGQLGRPELSHHFRRLLDDSDSAVINEAIDSIGKLQVREYVPDLISALNDKRCRAPARAALAAFGTSILGTLNDYLTDERQDFGVRRNIPRVISQVPHQRSVDLLTGLIDDVEPNLKYFVVKALNRLRSNHPELKFDEDVVDAALIHETRTYYAIAQTLRLNEWSNHGAGQLLHRALCERQDQNLERIFRLLGLHYPPRDIYSAYQGIVSTRRTVRASAVEFLDNLLKADIKKYLFPIIDQVSSDEVVRKGRELFGLQFENRADAIRHLIKGRDPWLRACALYCAIRENAREFDDVIRECVQDPDPIVRETASLKDV